MRTSVEPLEGNKVKLSVEVDDAEFEQALDDAFRKMAAEVRIPGFRPGKAPRRLLEARVGTGVARQEALRDALPAYYARALRDSEVDAIAPPEIDIRSGAEEGPIAFDAVVEVRPHVAIPGYEGLRVTVPSLEVTDEEVDAQVDRLRNQFAELEVVSRPARDGDNVTIDIKGYRHDQALDALSADDLLYEVGTGTIVAKLDEQLRGARAGDIFKFNDVAPGALTLAPDPTQETEVSFSVLVKEVKEKILPEANDEWAEEASEFDTVAELRDDLRNRMTTIKRTQAGVRLQDAAVAALVDLVDTDAPEPLIDAEIDRRLRDLATRLESQGASLGQYMEATGTSEEDLLTSLRDGAAQGVKADLALRALAEAEGLHADEDDVDAEIAQLADRLQQKAASLRRQLERAGQMGAVRSDIEKAKALQWLVEHVEVVDGEGRAVDRKALEPDPVPEAEPLSTPDPESTATPESVARPEPAAVSESPALPESPSAPSSEPAPPPSQSATDAPAPEETAVVEAPQ